MRLDPPADLSKVILKGHLCKVNILLGYFVFKNTISIKQLAEFQCLLNSQFTLYVQNAFRGCFIFLKSLSSKFEEIFSTAHSGKCDIMKSYTERDYTGLLLTIMALMCIQSYLSMFVYSECGQESLLSWGNYCNYTKQNPNRLFNCYP